MLDATLDADVTIAAKTLGISKRSLMENALRAYLQEIANYLPKD